MQLAHNWLFGHPKKVNINSQHSAYAFTKEVFIAIRFNHSVVGLEVSELNLHSCSASKLSAPQTSYLAFNLTGSRK